MPFNGRAVCMRQLVVESQKRTQADSNLNLLWKSLFTCSDRICQTEGFADTKMPFITGSSGDRERCPYVLMANSQSDMEEWLRTLRRVIGVPTSGGSVKPHFLCITLLLSYFHPTIFFLEIRGIVGGCGICSLGNTFLD